MTELAPRTTRILLLTLFATVVAAIAAPASASAFVMGIQSDGEIANPGTTAERTDDRIARMHAAGARAVRLNISWRLIAEDCRGRSVRALARHTNSCYEWTTTDNVVRSARKRRMDVILSVTRVPQWVIGNRDEYFVGRTKAQYNKVVLHYGAFMRAASTRYRSGSPKGFVKYWTVWTEPNSDTFWKPNGRTVPQRFAQMYGRAAVQVKAGSPRSKVAPGPTGPKSTPHRPVNFVRDFQRFLPRYLPGRTVRQKRRFIDAWAHNPYPGLVNPPRQRFYKSPLVGLGNMDDLFRQLDRHPLTRRLPVWGTEMGYQTKPADKLHGIPMHRQSWWLGESFDILDTSRRVPIAIWYVLTDPPQQVDWQSGLISLSGRAKPSFFMFQRPISVNKDKARRGEVIRIWGKSNASPRTMMLAYSFNGRKWIRVPRQARRADGVATARFRLTRKTWVRVWDRSGGTARGTYGPPRVINVRR